MPKIKNVRSSVALIVLFLTATCGFKIVYAQMARGTSISLELSDNNEARLGSIVSYKNGEFVLSSEPFDTEVFGVVVDTSSMSLTNPLEPNTKLVIQLGEAQILASNLNGQIKKGDYITTSKEPGIGQRADRTGLVIGKAGQDLVTNSPEEVALVWSLVEPRTAYINASTKINLLEVIRSGALSPLLNPIESLRYILAAIIVATTFIIGFSTFGKSSGRSIEALGRNPLAKTTIRTAMVFNMLLSFGVMLVGLALAYLILVL